MKFHIRTYGCQMNERDSEAFAGMLVSLGHRPAASEEEADLLILNTCSVRDQAERKAAGKAALLKKLKQRRPDMIIGIAGCMAQRRGEDLLRELPHVDFVLGTGQLHTLPALLEKIAAGRRRIVSTAESGAVLTGLDSRCPAPGVCTAHLAVTRGCNRFCSYCIVPYVRGREISRDPDDVVREARALADAGVREILLLGQNVAAYGLGGDVNPPPPDISPFADLLERLAGIDGIRRIRFTSPYVSYFNRRLIRAIAGTPKVCRCVHLPLQSGSDRILRAMNRQYTAESYLEVVDGLRSAMPEIAFSTDVIVGFPGETDDDFGATREMMNRVDFDNAFIFKYSPRPGTAAAAMPDSVPQEVKEERNRLLLEDLAARTGRHLRKMIGTTQIVLAEGRSRRMPSRWSGRTDGNRTVHFPPADGLKPGEMVRVRILRAGSVSLVGEITGRGNGL